MTKVRNQHDNVLNCFALRGIFIRLVSNHALIPGHAPSAILSQESVHKLPQRIVVEKLIPQTNIGSSKGIMNFLGTIIVVFLFLAILAWVGTIIGLFGGERLISVS